MALAARIMVDPASVKNYGDTATDLFGNMHKSLQALVDACVNVKYEGGNAVQFKTQAGQLADNFADGLHKDLNNMARSVSSAVTAISTSLGGMTVTLEVPGTPINPPTPTPSDIVDLDTTGLVALKGEVESQIGLIKADLETHKSTLTNTVWEGTAKERAVTEVAALTSHCDEQCETAKTEIWNFVDTQIDNVGRADV